MGLGSVSPDSTLMGREARPAPFMPREALAHLLKGAERHHRAAPVRNQREAGVLSVEPLYAFCLLDPFMRFLQVSPVVAELTGYSMEELPFMGLQEIVALDSMESTLLAFERIDSLDWSHHTVRFYRKDGVEAEARLDTIQLMDDQYLMWIREVRVKAGATLKVS